MFDWIIANRQWIFSGIGVFILTTLVGLISRILFRKYRGNEYKKVISEQETAVSGQAAGDIGAVLGPGGTVSGHIVARDLIINNHELNNKNLDSIKERLDELIDIFNSRADVIINQLSRHYHYAKIETYLTKFKSLHNAHVKALRKVHLIHAHEILSQIHKISFLLEEDDFWTRHRIETPHLNYALRDDAFERGRLVCMYIAGDMEKFSPKYPSTEGILSGGGESAEHSLFLYKKVLSQAN